MADNSTNSSIALAGEIITLAVTTIPGLITLYEKYRLNNSSLGLKPAADYIADAKTEFDAITAAAKAEGAS